MMLPVVSRKSVFEVLAASVRGPWDTGKQSDLALRDFQ